jgi:hypothetical protein
MAEPIPPDAEPERLRRRRNVTLLVVFALIAVALGIYPNVCTWVDQPQRYWQSYAQAPRTGVDALPALVPPSATEIHTRRDARQHLRWVRFTFAPAEHDRVVSGMRRLTLDEARSLEVVGPSFSPWWTVNERTMLGKAGNRLEVYEVPAPAGGWLFVDPASNSGFYWGPLP